MIDGAFKPMPLPDSRACLLKSPQRNKNVLRLQQVDHFIGSVGAGVMDISCLLFSWDTGDTNSWFLQEENFFLVFNWSSGEKTLGRRTILHLLVTEPATRCTPAWSRSLRAARRLWRFPWRRPSRSPDTTPDHPSREHWLLSTPTQQRRLQCRLQRSRAA